MEAELWSLRRREGGYSSFRPLGATPPQSDLHWVAWGSRWLRPQYSNQYDITTGEEGASPQLQVQSRLQPPKHDHMTTRSHDALPQRVRPLGSSSVRAQRRNVNDDVSPPHRVFGVIVVALVLRKVHKHLKHEKPSNENSEVRWKSQIKIRQV